MPSSHLSSQQHCYGNYYLPAPHLMATPISPHRAQQTAKMLALVALGNTSTLSGSTCTLNFSVPATQTAFTLGFFDGASNSLWDDNNGACDTSYDLYADPGGLGTGTDLVASWTDTDMTAETWSDFSVDNTSTALAPSGRSFYRLP